MEGEGLKKVYNRSTDSIELQHTKMENRKINMQGFIVILALASICAFMTFGFILSDRSNDPSIFKEMFITIGPMLLTGISSFITYQQGKKEEREKNELRSKEV